MKILIATNNKNKAAEIAALLSAEQKIKWQLMHLPKITEPKEPYPSFIENACHKAKYYGEQLNILALAEDTGLCVNALNQFPGVKTKEFVNENRSIDQAIAVLKQSLQHTTDYTASYVCAAALYIPQINIILHYEAKEIGHLIFPPRGEHGFGFDSVFVPQGYNHTIAELGMDVKNQQGHRAMAIKGLLQLFL